ncbi:hypothetical protein ACJX0J_033349, partial [Zea mays]
PPLAGGRTSSIHTHDASSCGWLTLYTTTGLGWGGSCQASRIFSFMIKEQASRRRGGARTEMAKAYFGYAVTLVNCLWFSIAVALHRNFYNCIMAFQNSQEEDLSRLEAAIYFFSVCARTSIVPIYGVHESCIVMLRSRTSTTIHDDYSASKQYMMIIRRYLVLWIPRTRDKQTENYIKELVDNCRYIYPVVSISSKKQRFAWIIKM